MSGSRIAVAVPVLAEEESLPRLMKLLGRQTWRDFEVFVCVNQPEGWWDDGVPQHAEACRENSRMLQYLNASDGAAADAGAVVHAIDRSSRGQAWEGKRKGVGWARKVLFEAALERCGEEVLIVSLDADTAVSDSYLASLHALFAQVGASLQAVAVPYRHPLTGDEECDRALLRYEVYMRHYLINLLRIGNPYAFSALGSAMAFTGKAYRRVGGITPLEGGEDFYLMQKFVKTGRIALRVPLEGGEASECVLPQGRPSWRVPFGTGPAVARGVEAMAEVYPFYSEESFEEVGRTYALFPALYDGDAETPMSEFLRGQLRRDDLWGPLRRNFKRRDLFVHACTELVDGLRILQYLRSRGQGSADVYGVDFATDPIETLDALRQRLFATEMQLRRQHG